MRILIRLLFLLPCAGAAAELDRIIVVVNEGAILESDLNKSYQIALLTAADEPPSRQEVLENMVIRRIQLDLAQRLNLYVSEKDQEHYIQGLLAQSGRTREEHERQLAVRGVRYAEWRREVSDSLLIGRLQRRQLREYIRISDQEIDDFLVDNIPAALAEAWYDLMHFVVPLDQASQADIEELIARLSVPNDRAELAADFASLPYQKTRTTDFGVKRLAELPRLFLRHVPLMSAGDLRYFRLDSSWHIIKAMDVVYSQPEYRVEYKLSSIPMLQSILYTPDQLRVRIDDIHRQLLEGTNFHDLAEIYSDPNNLLSNYELDWVGVEVLPRRIRDLLASLEMGSFSTPFFMDNGWYILLAEERRERDVSLDLLRERAFNRIARRKLSQSLPFWLNDIRSQAHVEYLGAD